MKYKIIDILRTFSDKEPRQFESFLMSPYHNDSKKIIRLYKALMKFYPEFEAIKMNEEKISHEVNPDLPYNKSTFKTMMFELANCADEFLKISIYKTKKATSEDYLREEYFKRKLFKLENQNALKMLSELDSDETWTSDNFYYKFRILTDLLNHHLTSAPRTNVDYGKILIKYLSNRTECVTNFFILVHRISSV